MGRFAIGCLGRSREPALQFLAVVVVINGLVCISAPAVIVLRDGGNTAPVGRFIFAMAVAALALTPLEVAAIWLVVAPRFRSYLQDRRCLRRINDVLHDAGLAIAFQPIYDFASGRAVGVESLSRLPAAGGGPDTWFADAERVGRGPDLEIVAIQAALAGAAHLPTGCYVAINVSPGLLTSPRLIDVLRCSDHLDRVVVELTEHTSVDDYADLQEARATLRRMGIRVAVDDAGAGYASMRHIVALTPDIIKIDRSLVTGIDTDPARRAMVAAVVMFALESGAAVIGEGVETPAELQTLIELGVDAAQGYLLGRPTTDSREWGAWTSTVLHPLADVAPLTALRPLPPM